jgi:hypothetical protein
VKNEHNFDDRGRSPFHFFPDLRDKFGNLPLMPDITTAARPLLVVHNKHNDEWGLGPVNYIPLATLNILFSMLKHDFTIVYIRHGMNSINPGFVEDHNAFIPFEDKCLLDNHPEVICFDTLYANHQALGGTQDINTFKNVLYSRCQHFVTSQGGGAHHIAQFSGSVIIVLHRRGSEEQWAYGDGYYGFMAPVSPIRVICRTEDDLLRALPLLVNTSIAGDRVMFASGTERLLAQFSPRATKQRRS